MRMTRQIVIQLLIFSVLATTALAVMVFGYMRAARHGRHRAVPSHRGTAGNRWAISAGQCHLSRRRGRQREERQPDRYRCRGGAFAELGHQDPRRRRSRGAQRVRGRRAVRRAAPAQRRRPVLEGRRRHPGRTAPRSRRTSTRFWTPTNRGLQAIPRDNLKTVIDEAYTAVGGLGPELSRLVKGATALAIDARKNLDPLTTLIDQSKPVLDSQTDTSGSIQAWAAQSGAASPVSCRARTRRSPGSREGRPAPPTRCGRCSTGCSRPCRSCWPTWSASARSRSPTSRASNSCWCCCRRAPRSLGHRRRQAATPNRTTWATT